MDNWMGTIIPQALDWLLERGYGKRIGQVSDTEGYFWPAKRRPRTRISSHRGNGNGTYSGDPGQTTPGGLLGE